MGNYKILKDHAAHIDKSLANPTLSTLIWEATRNCNLACRHCCIPKADWDLKKELSTDQAKAIFSSIACDFDPKGIHIAITGGEATLRKDLVEMVRFLTDLSFAQVSVDSNGLNYVKDITLVDRLFEAGMMGLTVGIDGMREGYKKTKGADAFDGIINVLKYMTSRYADKFPTTFTLVNNYNKEEIPELCDLLAGIGIKYARLGIMSPIGRGACLKDKGYKLSTKDFHDLMEFIGKKRKEFEEKKFPTELELSEDGWCGLKYESLTKPRGHMFFCQTGLYAAALLYDGKISACPHLPRNLSIQGDALKQRFGDVWRNEFKLFRDRGWCKIGKCLKCDQWEYCRGGPMHYRDITGKMKKCLYDEIMKLENLPLTLTKKKRSI